MSKSTKEALAGVLLLAGVALIVTGMVLSTALPTILIGSGVAVVVGAGYLGESANKAQHA